MRGAFLWAATWLLSGCIPTPYEAMTAAQRARLKKVIIPLPAGTPFKISRGAFGGGTHGVPGYEYAWDFDVPYGTPVLSVDDGLVIQVWEPIGKGGCDRKYNDTAHNVKIAADGDGTVAQYVHVDSEVRIGDKVKKGDIIALTADNGFHCHPQLHFNVFRDRDVIPETGQPRTIPVLFEGLPDGGVARAGYKGVAPP